MNIQMSWNVSQADALTAREALDATAISGRKLLPTIFLCCPRLFDIRYLVATGVIRSLAEEAYIVMFVPARYVEVVAKTLGHEVQIRELRVTDEDYEGVMPGLKGFRYRLCRMISTVFGFVYNRGYRRNLSQSLHIRNYLVKRRGDGVASRLRNRLIVGAALVLSYSRALRRLMQALFYFFAPKSAHRDHYEHFQPDLVVTCTFGLGSDGILMAEARYHGVSVATAVQSWDKTSTKGYPAILPDAALLWSDVTAEEARQFLDVPRERLHVEGAPLWDRHFRTNGFCTREVFFGAHRLDPQTKLIAVSIGSPCYHSGNLRLIDFLMEQMRQGGFDCPVSLLFRQHPGYLSYERERVEMTAFIAERSEFSNVAFMDVDVNEHGGALMYKEADSDYLCTMFFHCDLSISIVSSHLIEAAIFGKPAINIEYGQWVNEMYDFDLSQYTAEHLYRIYRTGAIYRALKEADLMKMANEALTLPSSAREPLARLVDQEAPKNRGFAAVHVAKRLITIAESSFSMKRHTVGDKNKVAIAR